MKKIISIVLLFAAMLLVFTGCGGSDTNTDSDKTSTGIEGTWKCVDLVMKEDGKKVANKKEYEELMGRSVAKLYKLSFYSDGKGDFGMMGEDVPLRWVKDGEKYDITVDYPAGVSEEEMSTDEMTMSFKGGEVIISMAGVTTSTDSDGVETKIKTEMILTFEATAKQTSRISKNMNIKLSDEETTAMSNFMNGGQYIYVNETLYGDFNDSKFAMATMEIGDEKVKATDKKLIMKDCVPYYLCAKDGYIYAALNANGEYKDQRIVKFKEGSTKMKTLYEGQCSYMQLVGDKLYFTDENWHYCKMNLDGKKKTTVIEKECYYPYVVNKQWIVYQDDDADESIHLYNVKTKEDIAVTTHKAYHPVIHGDYIYFMDFGDKTLAGKKYNFARYNLYSGETALYEEVFNQYFFITGDKVYFEDGACPYSELPDEWNTLFNKDVTGYVTQMRYSDSDIQIISYVGTDGEIYCYKTGMKDKRSLFTELKIK